MSGDDRKRPDVTIEFGRKPGEAGAGSDGEAAAAADQAAAAEEQAGDAVALEPGRGLDVGTANLISAVQDVDGNLTIRSQRNAFIDIEADHFTKNMLSRLNVQYAIVNSKMVVIGDAAFELANIFNRETRRPMRHGMISPQETEALPIERLLVEQVLGLPQVQGEVCYFSVPADPIDADANVIYHKGLFEGLLRKMGYTAKALQEGHAVVFSELADQEFTGIGISCGGGMFNVCVAYKSIPCLSFSTARAGDWIDENVAKVLGIKGSKACAMKERGMNLLQPHNREEEAIQIYYRNLINYTLTQIKHRFERADGMPQFNEAIQIVFSGGTSMIGGFEEVVREEFDKIRFPLDVSELRRAGDPLTSVAKGCLVAAKVDE